MRFHGIALLLALGAGLLHAQEDEGVEVSEDPPEAPEAPAKPRTIEQTVESGLSDLRSCTRKGRDEPRGRAVEAIVLHTRAVCGDLGKEDRKTLTAWYELWKRDSRHERSGDPLEVAATILALTAANVDPKAPPPAVSENANRPPRRSRFDTDHWKLMHECVVCLTGDGALRQAMDGGWGHGSDLTTTYFVLLALREAGRAGYPVDPQVFTKALDYLRKIGKGGTYQNPAVHGSTVTDQARGMVCTWICRERLALADPKGTLPDWSRELAERTALVDPVFKDPAQPPSIECLWAMEQLGSLIGQAQLGGRNWYREGTNRVLAAKWLAKDPETPDEVFSTCFALLFLKRQTAPLAAGK